MAKEELLTFRRYNDVALSAGLVSVLEKNDITYELIESPMVYSASLAFNEEINKEFVVKISANNFELVNNLLIDEETQHIDNIDNDYYLFAFSDEELMDVLTNYDEWNAFDFALARKILNERGVIVDDSTIKEIKAQKVEVLKQPEKSQTIWIAIGYLAALSGCIFGMFIAALGIFLGWHLSSGKKTLPNGDRVHIYIESNRKHGKRIFIIAIVVFVITFGLRFYQSMWTY